jgi:antitoxin (DNA-binding transcriptional repressor) of toxin-antitoxin stability system
VGWPTRENPERKFAVNAITVEQAQAQLGELIENLKPGEEIEVTKGDRTVATIVSKREPRVFGLGKGKLTILKEDDEYLKDFENNMP